MDVVARTVWLDAPGTLTFREEILGVPGPREILCETIVSVISPGTELAAFRGLPHLRPGVTYPRLLGYCNVARVLAVGEEVVGIAVHDRILTHQSHRSHFLIPAADVLLVLPPVADGAEIACSYLFHLGYEAVLSSRARPGSRVLVLGLGALGLTSVAAAHLAGAEVVAVSEHAGPAARARRMGANLVLRRADLAGTEFPWGPAGADIVIVTTNGWNDWGLALRHAADRGVVACLGFPGRGEGSPPMNPLASEYFYVKQLEIRAVGHAPQRPDARGFLRFNERDNLAFIARMILQGKLPASELLSGGYPAASIEDAYQTLSAREDSPVTFALEWKS